MFNFPNIFGNMPKPFSLECKVTSCGKSTNDFPTQLQASNATNSTFISFDWSGSAHLPLDQSLLKNEKI
jgi:hypothetical protein